VTAVGIFQVLFSFYQSQSKNGACCNRGPLVNEFRCASSLSPSCRIFFRVCLGHDQVELPPDPPCTFGVQTTLLLEANDFREPVNVSFDHTWQVCYRSLWMKPLSGHANVLIVFMVTNHNICLRCWDHKTVSCDYNKYFLVFTRNNLVAAKIQSSETIIWDHHLRLYIIWDNHLRLSSETIIWDNHLRQSSEAIIWNDHLRLSSESIIWDYYMRPSSQTIIWKYPLRLWYETIIWDYHLRLSSETIIWDYHLRLSSETIISDHHLRQSSETFIWNDHLRLSSETIIWNYHLRLSSETVIWDCHLRLSSETIIWDYLLRLSSHTIF